MLLPKQKSDTPIPTSTGYKDIYEINWSDYLRPNENKSVYFSGVISNVTDSKFYGPLEKPEELEKYQEISVGSDSNFHAKHKHCILRGNYVDKFDQGDKVRIKGKIKPKMTRERTGNIIIDSDKIEVEEIEKAD